MGVGTGNFSEFMTVGAVTEPEGDNPVWNAPAGQEHDVAQGEPVPSGPELTTPTIPPQQSRQSIAPDALNLSPLVEGYEPTSTPIAIPSHYDAWDGKTVKQITLKNNVAIRTIWMPQAPGIPFAIYSGTQTNGQPLFSTTGTANGTIALPDGNPTITFVSSGAFPRAVPIYATSEVLAPGLQNNSSDYPLGATPIGAVGSLTFSGSPGTINALYTFTITTGQNVYVSKLKTYGIYRQAMPFTFQYSAGFADSYSHFSGTDMDLAPIPPIMTTSAIPGYAGSVALVFKWWDTVVGTMAIDFEFAGYVL